VSASGDPLARTCAATGLTRLTTSDVRTACILLAIITRGNVLTSGTHVFHNL